MGRRGGRAGVRDPALGRRLSARPGRPAARPHHPGAPLGWDAADAALRRSSGMPCDPARALDAAADVAASAARGRPRLEGAPEPDAGDVVRRRPAGGQGAAERGQHAVPVPAAAAPPAPGLRPRARRAEAGIGPRRARRLPDLLLQRLARLPARAGTTLGDGLRALRDPPAGPAALLPRALPGRAARLGRARPGELGRLGRAPQRPLRRPRGRRSRPGARRSRPRCGSTGSGPAGSRSCLSRRSSATRSGR